MNSPRNTILSSNTTINEIYRNVSNDYHEISLLFNLKNDQAPPILATINCEDPRVHFQKAQTTLEIYPYPKENNTVNQIIEVISRWNEASAIYIPSIHTMVLNRYYGLQGASLPIALNHELTHSVTRTKNSYIPLYPEEFRLMNGYKPDFGARLYEVLNKYSSPYKSFALGLDEFFPPLSEAYFFGLHNTTSINWSNYFSSINSVFSPTKEEVEKKRLEKISSLILHLPQIAGELLIRQYNGNIIELVSNHPSIAHEDPLTLWSNYIRPILINGKI